MNYQRILIAEDGPDAALSVYDGLERQEHPQVALARARLLPTIERLPALAALTVAAPDFAPTQYELSLESSARKRGKQTLRDKSRELVALDRFLELSTDTETYHAAFLDLAVASDWREDAQGRRRALDDFDASVAENPMTMRTMVSNYGAILFFEVSEKHDGIEYRREGDADFTPISGTVQLPGKVEFERIEARYKDLHGDYIGPFEFVADARYTALEMGKDGLRRTPDRWLALRNFGGSTLVYFTALVVQRCAISKVEYGIDRPVPDTEFVLPACDAGHNAPIRSGTTLHVEAPAKTTYVSVKLTFADGTASRTVRIDKDK